MIPIKNTLHVTHKVVDPDGFASILWGSWFFNGWYYLDSPTIVVQRMIDRLNIKVEKYSSHVNVDFIFIYDVNEKDRLALPQDVKLERYVLFDHHPKYEEEFFKNSLRYFHKARAALVMNLYDYSTHVKRDIPDEILLMFAVALVTDTALLRTATKEELIYLGYFLKKRRLEDVFEIIIKGRLDKEILRRVENMRIIDISGMKVGILRVRNDDEFHLFIDTLFEPLGLDLIIGDTKWGSWVFTRKKLLQKINRIFKESGFEWHGWGRIERKKWWDILETLEKIDGKDKSNEYVDQRSYDHRTN